ncbi:MULTISPECIES: hypothetical protein [Actinoalloteichus]|uniref:Uncharacterized protein n=1 Tax=Actinoalloteichus fjordicus TaxID=1612552 RepID=A0AAC9LGD5_9PSEU|nr:MULTISPECIES: hypothetical protein [Actinoalloteichus]APU16374.1 hypothetical protein UA74_21760 [Actinoalloteichus fjordicus]APU22432.1 hypothetical protein UA75_22230 [Actinoalloteichus sp. GBA129-24]
MRLRSRHPRSALVGGTSPDHRVGTTLRRLFDAHQRGDLSARLDALAVAQA